MKVFNKAALVILLISLLVLTACNENTTNSESSNTDNKKYEIAGILMQSDVEWFKQIQLGMEKAAKDYNVNLKIGNSNLDLAEESNLIDTYSSQGMDAIVMSAIDSSSSTQAIKRALEKDVTVINYNTNVDEEVMKYFVGIDNFELGAQAGKILVDYVNEHLNGKQS